MGRPIYVERCSVSFHRLGITRPDAQARIIDFELIADRLSRDAEERNPDRDGLTEYLKANAQRVLLEDLYVLMQTGTDKPEPYDCMETTYPVVGQASSMAKRSLPLVVKRRSSAV